MTALTSLPIDELDAGKDQLRLIIRLIRLIIAERSKACSVYHSLNVEIAGSNPARGMDVCLRVSVLCCPV
jgi:hypothetical protein